MLRHGLPTMPRRRPKVSTAPPMGRRPAVDLVTRSGDLATTMGPADFAAAFTRRSSHRVCRESLVFFIAAFELLAFIGGGGVTACALVDGGVSGVASGITRLAIDVV